jgi:hypothetical protein
MVVNRAEPRFCLGCKMIKMNRSKLIFFQENKNPPISLPASAVPFLLLLHVPLILAFAVPFLLLLHVSLILAFTVPFLLLLSVPLILAFAVPFLLLLPVPLIVVAIFKCPVLS